MSDTKTQNSEKAVKKSTTKVSSNKVAKKTVVKKATKKIEEKAPVVKKEVVKKETVKKAAKKATKKVAKKAVKKETVKKDHVNLSAEANNLKEILIDTPEKKEKRAAEDLEQAKEHFEHVVEEVIKTSLYTLDYLAEKTDALIDRTEIKIKDCYSKASKFYDKYPLLTSTILTTATTIFAKAIKLKMKLNKKK